MTNVKIQMLNYYHLCLSFGLWCLGIGILSLGFVSEFGFRTSAERGFCPAIFLFFCRLFPGETPGPTT